MLTESIDKASKSEISERIRGQKDLTSPGRSLRSASSLKSGKKTVMNVQLIFFVTSIIAEVTFFPSYCFDLI